MVNRDIREKSDEASHMHEFVELEYVISGTGIQIINNIEYSIQKGDVIFLNIGDNHSYISKNKLKILNCIFYPEVFSEIKMVLESEIGEFNHLLPNFKRLPVNYIFEVEDLLSKIERELNVKSFGYNVILKSYITALLTFFVRATNMNTTKNSSISNILEYMETNFINVSLNEIAGYFNFSSTYFSKYFKNNIGMSFSKYVNDKKIHEAIKLVNETNDTIVNICTKIGYKDSKQFYKIFKEYVGMTPNSMRKNFKKLNK